MDTQDCMYPLPGMEHTPSIPAPRRQRQQVSVSGRPASKFQGRQGYIAKPYLKNKQANKQEPHQTKKQNQKQAKGKNSRKTLCPVLVLSSQILCTLFL